MKIKKRIIALNIGIVAVMLFSFFYVMAVGSHYPMHTNHYFPDGKLPEDTKVVMDNKNVVKCAGVRIEDKALVVDFDAVNMGESKVKLTYTYGGNKFKSDPYTLKVNIFNTIIDSTGGIINFNGYRTIIHAIIFQLVFAEIIMLWMYIDYRRKGEFSYAMIACGGISIYLFILLAYNAYFIINNYLTSFTHFLTLISSAGMIMLLLLAPIMMLLSFLLAISNIWLIRHEGYRPMNMLGVAFAAVWFIGAVLTIGAIFFNFVWKIPFYSEMLIPLIYIVGYFECMFISTVACSYLATKYKIPCDRDYIIILGCSIRKDGTPTPLLKARVDSAVEFGKKQFEKTGKHAVFVPSGGQGSDEVVSEAKAMENYLLSIGIPKNQILMEDKSKNTFENMKFSKELIKNNTNDFENQKIAFSTTNYHVFRGYVLVKKNNFEAKGISAKTKQYFFPNAFIREFVGLLVDKKWKHIIFVALTVVFFVLLTSLL